MPLEVMNDNLTPDQRVRLEALAQSIGYHSSRTMSGVTAVLPTEERIMVTALAFEQFLKDAPAQKVPNMMPQGQVVS